MAPEGARGRSAPNPPSKKRAASPKTPRTPKVQAARSADMLDQIVAIVGLPGLVASLVAVSGAAVAVQGAPEDYALPLCALAMGMGKGGVPGFSTLASAFFALLAPVGGLNQMLAIVVPITMLSDILVGITYFRDAKWKVAGNLLVWTAIGIGIGMWVNTMITEDVVRRVIGVVFIGVVLWLLYEGSGQKSKDEAKANLEFLHSLKVIAPVGIIGGIASYITNNMGPMLNVYLIAIQLDKYELVGTRSAIFTSVNIVKFFMRTYAGHLQMDGMETGLKLGLVSCAGVILAKVWLVKASKEFFAFMYRWVTLSVVSVTGALLVAGWDFNGLAKFCMEHGGQLWRTYTMA